MQELDPGKKYLTTYFCSWETFYLLIVKVKQHRKRQLWHKLRECLIASCGSQWLRKPFQPGLFYDSVKFLNPQTTNSATKWKLQTKASYHEGELFLLCSASPLQTQMCSVVLSLLLLRAEVKEFHSGKECNGFSS